MKASKGYPGVLGITMHGRASVATPNYTQSSTINYNLFINTGRSFSFAILVSQNTFFLCGSRQCALGRFRLDTCVKLQYTHKSWEVRKIIATIDFKVLYVSIIHLARLWGCTTTFGKHLERRAYRSVESICTGERATQQAPFQILHTRTQQHSPWPYPRAPRLPLPCKLWSIVVGSILVFLFTSHQRNETHHEQQLLAKNTFPGNSPILSKTWQLFHTLYKVLKNGR